MAFRTPQGPTSYYPPGVNTQQLGQQQHQDDHYPVGTSPTIRTKRPRPLDMQADDAHNHPSAAPAIPDQFIQDQEANDDGEDEEDEEGDGKKSDKKAGRRKIKIEFIQDKSRRHITFSKRKAGIMKKAYELSTLTGTQVLLLVVSETGLVYTFTTAKLQPLVTQPEGKNLIQACLNAPHGQLPAPSGGGGQPMNRMGNSSNQQTRSNVPGGLSIGGTKEDEAEGEEDDETGGATPNPTKPRTRRRTSSGAVPGGIPTTTGGNQKGPSNSPTSPNQPTPPQPAMGLHQQQGGAHPQMALNPPHGQPQQYSQTGHASHNQVPNVGPYSNTPDASGGYLSGHGHTGHPQMLAQYHLNQPANHQPPQHWGGQPTQPVSQNAQYGRR